jgi:hypothetical protein
MVMANINGRQATSIKANIKMIKDMVMERCFGMMEVSIKEIGKKEYSKDLEGCCLQMARQRKAILRMEYLRLKEVNKR